MSHWGSSSLMCCEVCFVTRLGFFPFLPARIIAIIPALLPIVTLSPVTRSFEALLELKFIHHLGHLPICEQCYRTWMNYLSTTGRLKYLGLVACSGTTWAGSWSGSVRRAMHWPGALQRLRTTTFPYKPIQISPCKLMAQSRSMGMWQLSNWHHAESNGRG